MRFFRKTRQALLKQNKVGKYLLYALGEVVLVVIGILIALRVNNLNEQHKADMKEERFLISMRSELMDNLDIVKSEINELRRSIDSQRTLLNLINSDEKAVEQKELSRILAMSFSRVFELRYQDGTFKELLYSGGLVFIKNDSIKNEVTSWEGRMISVRKQEEGVYAARDRITDFLLEEGVFKVMLDDAGVASNLQIRQSIRKNGAGSKAVLKSQKFENLVAYHIALNISQESYYERLADDIEDLLQMVNSELKK